MKFLLPAFVLGVGFVFPGKIVAAPINCGEPVPVSLFGTETTEFTFSGNAGDRILFNLLPEDGSASIETPAVDLLASVSGDPVVLGGQGLSVAELPTTGEYKFVARNPFPEAECCVDSELNLDWLGPSESQCADAALTFGENLVAEVGAVEEDLYNFVGSAGDTFSLTVTREPESTFGTTVQYELYGPDVAGSLIQGTVPVSNSQSTSVMDDLDLPVSGTYTLRIRVAEPFETPQNVAYVLFTQLTAPTTLFQRGDIDFSGDHDISDAINSLNFQFLGTFEPLCRDALDLNDSGDIDISDPVLSLLFLFVGGVTVAEPFSECGPDTTPDAPVELTCDSFPICNS